MSQKKKKIEEWQKTADIANKYGKDGWISTLKNAIDILLIQEKEKLLERIEKEVEKINKNPKITNVGEIFFELSRLKSFLETLKQEIKKEL